MNSKVFRKKFTITLLIYTSILLCIWILYNGVIYWSMNNTMYDNLEAEAERMLTSIDSDLSPIKISASLIGGSPYVKDFLAEKDIDSYYEKSEEANEIVAKVMGVNALFDHVITINEDGDFYRFVGSLSNETISVLFHELRGKDASFYTMMLEGTGYFCYFAPVFSTNIDSPDRIGSILIANSLSRTRRMLEQGRPPGIETSVVAGEQILLSTEKALEGRQKSLIAESHDFFAEQLVKGTDLSVVVSANKDQYMPINAAFLGSSVLIILLFLISIFTLYRYLSKNMLLPLISTKDQMQMGLLGRQMDAHFVVNTLKNIEILIQKKETENAQSVMHSLCDILKHQQRGVCNVFVELNVLERYIEIMNMRHNKRYRIEVDIDEEMVQYAMPAFVLQPILENAFLHGFSGENEAFTVEIKGFIREDKMVFQIADNGLGIPEDRLPEIQAALEHARVKEYPQEGLGGVALLNIQQRIVSQYGSQYGIRIQSAVQRGTTVTIELPLLPDESFELK